MLLTPLYSEKTIRLLLLINILAMMPTVYQRNSRLQPDTTITNFLIHMPNISANQIFYITYY